MSMAAPYGATRRRPKRPAGRTSWLAATAIVLGLLAARPAAARVIKILVLGDSLAAGYGLPHEDGFQQQLIRALAGAGHAVTIADAAVSGDTAAGGRARLNWALSDAPDCAIVELGANDGLRGSDTGQLQANLAAILDTLAARRLPVLLAGMLAPPNYGHAYTDSFRAVYARLAQRPGVLFEPFFLEGVAADRSLEQADGMHPNAAGVQRVVARILPLVEQLIARVPQDAADTTRATAPGGAPAAAAAPAKAPG